MEKILIEKLENHIHQNKKDDIWKDYFEIETITGIDIHDVIKILRDCDKNLFCRNTNDKYTTRKMYEQYLSFWTKLRDSFAGRII
jgi:hypothetical protein